LRNLALGRRAAYQANMPRNSFSHVTTWVFDLDNTLYPPSARLFDLIEVRMTDWVMRAIGVERAEADRLRAHYWRTHGTTLAGLMREHDVDPAPYLEDVHNISMDSLIPDPELAARITDLPGRRIVYTNGCAPYAERVLAARGLGGIFDAVYGVEHAAFLPKPDREAFDTVFAADGLDPTSAAMFEDDARNLEAPFKMGMQTVHVAPARRDAAYIHHHTDDLSGFLGHLTA
jgi:putative hydrolase of the HAD superfamily